MLSKYQIGNFENNKLIGERYLTINEYNEFKKSHSFILNCRQIIHLYNILVRNYNEIIDFDSDLNIILLNADYSTINNKSKNVHIEINRLLLNYLSSFRLYVDYLQTKFSRSESLKPMVNDYKNIVAECFDSSFAYRFLYKLRNYTQHIDLPIETVSLKTKRISKGNYSYSIPIYFERDSLLEKYKEWGIVKNDLEKMSKYFDLYEIMDEHFYSMKYIYSHVYSLIKGAASPYTTFLNNLTFEYRKGLKGLCVFKSKPIYENSKVIGENIKLQPIHLELLDYYTLEFKNK